MAAEKEPGRLERLRESARRIDSSEGLAGAARATREALPGDKAVGDPLSTASNRPTDLLARYLAEVGDRPSATRELGLAAVQLFQVFSESRGRGRGTLDMAILFTDLVGFSSWALEAGDADAVRLLRDVSATVEPAIKAHHGEIVKRLGDGHMAAFRSAASAVLAAHEAQVGLRGVSVAGYAPELRAGVHVGRPRRLGGDYLGVDVNIAARVADAADGGQILASKPACVQLDEAEFEVHPKRRFRAKGAPSDLEVCTVAPRA
jgi:adenylate cyclase